MPDFSVTARGIGEVEDSGVGEVLGREKDTTSSTRMPFSGSSAVGRSKAPLRLDW